MRSKQVLLAVGLAVVLAVPITANAAVGGTTTWIDAARHGQSLPLRDIIANLQPYEGPDHTPREIPNDPEPLPDWVLAMQNRPSGGPNPMVQSHPGPSAPVPLTAWDGYGSDDNATLFSTRYAPPDSEGDIGLTYYVSWNNIGYYIFDRAGAVIAGPIPGNELWTGFGGDCETSNDGDPIVLYDHLAGRWVFTQFALRERITSASPSRRPATSSDRTGCTTSSGLPRTTTPRSRSGPMPTTTRSTSSAERVRTVRRSSARSSGSRC
jgi:hypothetical protein